MNNLNDDGPIAQRLCACGSPVTRHSASGLCRRCSNTDPATIAKRAEGRRLTFLYHPERRAAQIAAVSEANRRPERRTQSGEQATALRIWEKGLPATKAPDAIKRQRDAMCERRMAHIPLAYRDTYKRLVRKVGASEAKRMVIDLAAAAVRKAHG